MPPSEQSVRDLTWFRRQRGLTQGDLALLLGVTQQAVAKWERSQTVPRNRLKEIARHLRIGIEALLPPNEGAPEERRARLSASMEELFADQLVLCFPDASFHYTPSSDEVRQFWRDLQHGGLVHLSAGPVQVLVNMDAIVRLDVSEDPPISSYSPPPVSPVDVVLDDDESDAEGATAPPEFWFDRGDARVYLRGVREPYSGHQGFFDGILDQTDITSEDLISLHVRFEGRRSDEDSIFDLFHNLTFHVGLGEAPVDRNDDLHPDHLHVFASEDTDDVRQHTWVHTRDVQVIEVPTRLWELLARSTEARVADLEKKSAPANRTPRRSRQTRGRR